MSAIKFRKRLTKFKITIALPKKFGSKGFIKPEEKTKLAGEDMYLLKTGKLTLILLLNETKLWSLKIDDCLLQVTYKTGLCI